MHRNLHCNVCGQPGIIPFYLENEEICYDCAHWSSEYIKSRVVSDDDPTAALKVAADLGYKKAWYHLLWWIYLHKIKGKECAT